MALQYGTTLRNAQLDQVEVITGTTAKLRMYTGGAPADCQTAASGTVLAEITLPSDWMQNAASGTKQKSTAAWQGTATASGTFGYFRVWDNAVSVCHAQGSLGTAGDMVTDAATVNTGQTVTVNTFTLTAGNA